MQGLYAIIDTESLLAAGVDVLRFADAVLAARPGALQLRDKRRDSQDHLRLLHALAPRCADAGVPLWGNDRADLALLADCHGVHVGQEDLPPSAVRSLAEAKQRPDFQVGMSVHDPAELAIAIAEAPDYIALGPVFDTRSKTNLEPTLGLAGLAALASGAESAGKPRVAIGGITPDTAAAVAEHCEMLAVIGALVDTSAADPYAAATRRARTLHELAGGGT